MTVTRARFSILGCAVFILFPGVALGENLSVSFALEDSVLLEGQTAFVILRVRNTTPRTVMEPDIRIEHFRARLVRIDTGQEVPSSYSGEGLFGHVRGRILKQGEIHCSVRNLESQYGDQADSTWGRLRWTYLESGPYALTWEVRTRHDSLRKGEVRFSVLPLESDITEFDLIRSFESTLPAFDLPRYAREKLPEFYGSKYLIRTYTRTRALDELNFEDIYEGMVRAGAPAERRATLIGLRLSMTDQRGQFTPEWRRRMAAKVGSQIERDVLAIPPRTPAHDGYDRTRGRWTQ